MTLIVGLPINDVGRLIKERLTSEQRRNASSFRNKYRLTTVKIANCSQVYILFGKAKRQMEKAELLQLLKQCMDRLEDPMPGLDAWFYHKILVRLKHKREPSLTVPQLLRLRKIARGEFSRTRVVEPEQEKKKEAHKKLRRFLALQQGRATQAKKRVVVPILNGCSYLNPLTGVRCGFPCEEKNLCDEHKDYIPPDNGHGSIYYANNRR